MNYLSNIKKNKVIIILVLLVGLVSTSLFFINKEKKQNEIKQLSGKTQISYMKQFAKDHPDMVPIIKKREDCLKGKVKPIEGCQAYTFKDLNSQQKLMLQTYLNELKNIRTEFNKKLNN
jgi:hypothetical protein